MFHKKKICTVDAKIRTEKKFDLHMTTTTNLFRGEKNVTVTNKTKGTLHIDVVLVTRTPMLKSKSENVEVLGIKSEN